MIIRLTMYLLLSYAIISFVAQRRFEWVNSAHFFGKKAVRILSRIYSSSR